MKSFLIAQLSKKCKGRLARQEEVPAAFDIHEVGNSRLTVDFLELSELEAL